MSTTPATSALLDGRPSGGGRAPQRHVLLLLGSLATAGGLYGLSALVLDGYEREAGRIAVQQEAGTLAVLVGGYAARHGWPNRH